MHEKIDHVMQNTINNILNKSEQAIEKFLKNRTKFQCIEFHILKEIRLT